MRTITRQGPVPDEAAEVLQNGDDPGLLVHLAHGQADLGHALQGRVQHDQPEAVQAVLRAQGQESIGIRLSSGLKRKGRQLP